MQERRFLIAVLFILYMPGVQAQTISSMTGEYYLKGVTEVASGFQLNADSTFKFFFSYGALDRYGMGNWSIRDGKVVLNSRLQPEKDFAMVTSKSVSGNKTSIRIIENNSMLFPYVHVRISSGGKEDTMIPDKKGLIVLTGKRIDSISLLFEFCPERYSIFHIKDVTNNFFEFRFEPWLMEVFFSNFSLQVDTAGLLGRHPLMQGEQYRYNK